MLRKYRNILAVLLLMATSLQAQVLTSDSLALVAFYNQTNGTSWTTKDNWLTGSVGTWYGITRTGNRVTSISLTTNNLTGTLPSSIGNLTGLTQIALGNNKLTGSIPVEIGNLVNLKFLYLWSNQLSGQIPSTIGNLTSLENLQLFSNQLTGSIPTTFGNLIALKYLTLRSNSLTGGIPSTIGNLTNLEFLYLQSNQLSGNLPSEFGNLIKLKDLFLNDNQLTGELPGSLSNLTQLQKLVLNKNQFNGSLAMLMNLSSLMFLDLQDNAYTGIIPTQIGNLTGLTDLYLGNEVDGVIKNQFTGDIPASIGSLTSLSNLKLKSNQLSGSLPQEFNNLVNLKTVDLNNNELTSLPDLSGLPLLTSFDVRNNYLIFQDIYKNRNINGFLYDPQKSSQIQDSVQDKADVNSEYVISVLDNTPGNEYEWFRNGVAVNPPNPSPTYQIISLNRSNMGEYTCVITNPTIPELTFYYKHTVLAKAIIGGKLTTETNGIPSSGNAQLYEVTTSGAYKKIDEQLISPQGDYQFLDVVLSDYLIKGTAVSSNPNLIPTWWNRSIYWEMADVLVLTKNELDINIQSEVKPDPPIVGQGEISGVFYETTPDGRVLGRKAVKKASVTISRDEGSGRGQALILVAYTYTDDNGEFIFSQLPPNTYRLNIQYPGYPMDESSYIDIPIVDNLFERQVRVEAEVFLNKIKVRKLVITGWLEQHHSLSAYPNPTLENLYITNRQENLELAEFKLIDELGKVIPVTFLMNKVENRWEMDVQQMKPGVYTLSVTLQGKTELLRILIQ